MAREIWKWVVGYEGYYQVSNCGNVRSVDRVIEYSTGQIRQHRGQVLKRRLDGGGYPHVSLYDSGQEWDAKTHRLVLETFVSPSPEGHECNHIDGDKLNNRIENLEWVTPGENNRHAYENGLNQNAGEGHCWAKLTAHQVREIRQLYATGNYYQREIGAMFGVASTTVSRIVAGKRWALSYREGVQNERAA